MSETTDKEQPSHGKGSQEYKMKIHGVDVSKLTPEEIQMNIIFPRKPDPKVVMESARRRQKAWAYNPSHPRYCSEMARAGERLRKEAVKKTIRNLKRLVQTKMQDQP